MGGPSNGAERPDFPDPDDADSGAIHDAAVDPLRGMDPGADPASRDSLFGTLCRAACAGYGYGYLRALRDSQAGLSRSSWGRTESFR